MKRFIVILVVLGLYTQTYSQVPHGTIDNKRNNTLLNFGIGASHWGVPFYFQGEQFIYRELTLGGELGLLFNSETNLGNTYKHTMISFGGLSNYYFDNLLELPVFLDLYAGIAAGFIHVSHTSTIAGSPAYTGNIDSGLYLGLHVGSRYYFSNRWAAQLELELGTAFGGIKIGATYRL